MASSGGITLSSLLPAPSQNSWDRDEARAKQAGEGGGSSSSTSLVSASRTAPPYGKRKGWIPRTVDDFGDGGAYPEIHVAQYPLGNFIYVETEFRGGVELVRGLQIIFSLVLPTVDLKT